MHEAGYIFYDGNVDSVTLTPVAGHLWKFTDRTLVPLLEDGQAIPFSDSLFCSIDTDDGLQNLNLVVSNFCEKIENFHFFTHRRELGSNPVFQAMIKSFKNLKRLSIEMPNWALADNEIAGCIETLPSLVSLSLVFRKRAPFDVDVFSTAISRLPKLTALRITGLSRLSDALGTAFLKFKNVEILDLDGASTHLVKCLKSLHRLSSFTLRDVPVADIGKKFLRAFEDLLEASKSLQKVDIRAVSNHNHTSWFVRYVTNAMFKKKFASSLSLTKAAFGDESKGLCELLTNSQLRTLELYSPTDLDLGMLAASLRGSKISKFALTNVEFDSKEIDMICDSLMEAKELVELDLGGLSLSLTCTEHKCIPLLKLIMNHPSLEVLNLNDSKIYSYEFSSLLSQVISSGYSRLSKVSLKGLTDVAYEVVTSIDRLECHNFTLSSVTRDYTGEETDGLRFEQFLARNELISSSWCKMLLYLKMSRMMAVCSHLDFNIACVITSFLPSARTSGMGKMEIPLLSSVDFQLTHEIDRLEHK
jgi:hypothetical protein